MKLAVVTSHPIQYQAPIWRELHHAQALELEVFFASLQGGETYFDPGFGRMVKWDVPLLDGYPWRQARNLPLDFVNWRFKYCVPGMESLLRTGGFTHLLLVGKEYAYYHQALHAAKRLGLKVLYRAESHPAKSNALVLRLAKWTRRSWYRSIDAFLCVGRYQYAEYAAYGVAASRMFFAPYCVDQEHFAAQRRRLTPERDAIRKGYGFAPDTVVIGYTGKLYDRKNPLELLRAFESLPDDGRQYGLLMAGDGPQRSECERLASGVKRGPVVFTGFLNQTELGRAYVAMDIFVMPSLWETWGLAVNEAMAFGLPVIATSAVNAAQDLIVDGETGYRYAAGDTGGLAQSIARISALPDRGRAMGAAGSQRVAPYSVARAAAGVMEAVRATAGGRD